MSLFKKFKNTLRAAASNVLLFAARNNFLQLEKLSIYLGADINAQDDTGKTALMYAVISNNISSMILLLSNKADLEILDKDGHNVYFHANDKGLKIQSLLETTNIARDIASGVSSLRSSLNNGLESINKELPNYYEVHNTIRDIRHQADQEVRYIAHTTRDIAIDGIQRIGTKAYQAYYAALPSFQAFRNTFNNNCNKAKISEIAKKAHEKLPERQTVAKGVALATTAGLAYSCLGA